MVSGTRESCGRCVRTTRQFHSFLHQLRAVYEFTRMPILPCCARSCSVCWGSFLWVPYGNTAALATANYRELSAVCPLTCRLHFSISPISPTTHSLSPFPLFSYCSPAHVHPAGRVRLADYLNFQRQAVGHLGPARYGLQRTLHGGGGPDRLRADHGDCADRHAHWLTVDPRL